MAVSDGTENLLPPAEYLNYETYNCCCRKVPILTAALAFVAFDSLIILSGFFALVYFIADLSAQFFYLNFLSSAILIILLATTLIFILIYIGSIFLTFLGLFAKIATNLTPYLVIQAINIAFISCGLLVAGIFFFTQYCELYEEVTTKIGNDWALPIIFIAGFTITFVYTYMIFRFRVTLKAYQLLRLRVCNKQDKLCKADGDCVDLHESPKISTEKCVKNGVQYVGLQPDMSSNNYGNLTYVDDE